MHYTYTLAASAAVLSSLLSSAAAYTPDNNLYVRYADPSLDDVYDLLYARDAYADPDADPDAEAWWLDNDDDGYDISLYARTPIKGGVPDLPKRPQKFGPQPPAKVDVEWRKGATSNKKKYREGNEEAKKLTKSALEHENRTDPPKSPKGTATQWNKATINHGFDNDSSKRPDGQPGGKGHINALAKAQNGYQTNKHIGKDGKVVPKKGKRDVVEVLEDLLFRREMEELFGYAY